MCPGVNRVRNTLESSGKNAHPCESEKVKEGRPRSVSGGTREIEKFSARSDAADVNFLGPHHFTLQEDTPLYWLDNGAALQRYLLKARIQRTAIPRIQTHMR